MGAGESKAKVKSSDNVTKDDVRKLLNEQKRQYELLLKAQQRNTQQEAKQLLDEQKKQYDDLLLKALQQKQQEAENASSLERTPNQPITTCTYENSKISSPSGISTTASSHQPITRTTDFPSTSHGFSATSNINLYTLPVPETSNNVKHQRPVNENDELSCPTCKQSYTICIYQCDRGHSSCSNCKRLLIPCGICGYPIGDIRNISLESYLAERKVPCPNSNDGCRLIIKMADLEIHGRECPFREMLCPLAAIFGQCQWQGKLSQLSEHFKHFHPNQCTANVDYEMILTRNETQMVHYVLLGEFNFLFHIKVSEYDRKIYMTVQLIGTKQSAGKWTYEVHVYNKNQPRRKYQYVDLCHSNSIPLSEIYSEEKCAILPFCYAENFYNRNCINYKFYIKKDINSKSSKYRDGARRRAKSVTPLA